MSSNWTKLLQLFEWLELVRLHETATSNCRYYRYLYNTIIISLFIKLKDYSFLKNY